MSTENKFSVGKIVGFAIGLAALGVTIYVASAAWRKGQKA